MQSTRTLRHLVLGGTLTPSAIRPFRRSDAKSAQDMYVRTETQTLRSHDDKPQALQLPTPDLPSIHRVASSAARGEALPAAVRERALEGIVGELTRASPQLPHHE